MEAIFFVGPAVLGFLLIWIGERIARYLGWQQMRAESRFVLAFLLGGAATAVVWLVAQQVLIRWLAWQVDTLAGNVGLPLNTRGELNLFLLGYQFVLRLQMFILGYHFVLGGIGGAIADRVMAAAPTPAELPRPVSTVETEPATRSESAQPVQSAVTATHRTAWAGGSRRGRKERGAPVSPNTAR